MIRRLSDDISCYLCSSLSYSDDKREVLSYGLQIVLGTSAKIISIAILAIIFDIFVSTAVVSITFIIFRRIIGGVHCDTYNKCYFVSVSLMLLLGFLGSTPLVQSNHIIGLLIGIYLICVFITIKWVPMGTNKKAIKNKETRRRIKLKTLTMLTLWFITLVIFKDLTSSQIGLSSLLSILLAFFMATPLMNGVKIEL